MGPADRLVVAFLYNVRAVYPDPGAFETQLEADFDDAATIDAMREELEGLDIDLLCIEADEHAAATLYAERARIDVALNYSIGRRGAARYAQIPALLELLGIPYTGSDPLVQALIQDKPRMQMILERSGVRVPPSEVVWGVQDADRVRLDFPLLVKPAAQGSSAGITRHSLVEDGDGLRRQVAAVIEGFGAPALVQTFLPGREFSVPLLGNPPRVLPIVEPEFARLPKDYPPIDTLEVKWYFEEDSAEHHLACPARIERDMEIAIHDIVLRTWQALGLRDWCRVDLRADASGELHVLDVNSPPGMIPPRISQTSYLPLSARAAGISYREVLDSVIRMASERGRHGG